MDNNQTDRRSINLSKDDHKVREAYPVYNNNPDMDTLNRSEYRNQQSSYSQNNYGSNSNTNSGSGLNHYYDYNDPQPTEDMYNTSYQQQYHTPRPDPQVHRLPRGQQYQDNRGYQQPQQYPTFQQQPQVTYHPQPMQPQHDTKYCKYCGGKIPSAAVVCTLCGQQVEQLTMGAMPQGQMIYQNNASVPYQSMLNTSAKSKTTTLVLAALGFIGVGGLHRLYAGKIVSGIVYLLTGGLCGIGTIIDLLKIASNTFTDGAGMIIRNQ